MARRRRSAHRLSVECLEPRALPAGLPWGAMPDDTAEFLLGDVLISVVLMESNQQISSINDNSETWTSQAIARVKDKVREGAEWWSDTLASITDRHELNFEFDFTYADQPVSTPYEPITRPSTDFRFWIYDFLNPAGFNQTGDFSSDIRQFNHAQRQAHGTDWAFTLFVVNDENDDNGQFATGGFTRAFAYAGGRFFVTPAGRPASTIAHETGHMFWARDEYQGGGSYNTFRGYYDTQNLNAWDNPDSGFQPVPSIMERGDCESGGGLLCTAYQNHTSSPSSLAMVGWQDSDGDGVFDVLDVPLELQGNGFYDAQNNQYHFRGQAQVATLPNKNSDGLQNDITINEISRLEYRFDGGPWQTAQEFVDRFRVDLDAQIPWQTGAREIEIRVIDRVTGISSATLQGTRDQPAALHPSGISGIAWHDSNRSGTWDSGEKGVAGWTVQLVDQNGSLAPTLQLLEPDEHGSSAYLNEVLPGVTVSAVGSGLSSDSVFAMRSDVAVTGNLVFAGESPNCGGSCLDWTSQSRTLRIDFTEPASQIRLDATARINNSFGRLEIYDSNNRLLGRYTTAALAHGQVETMTLSRPQSDIAYAIAKGHASTTVQFDRLRIGTEAETTTDQDGAYAFAPLSGGQYTVQVVAQGIAEPVSPADARQAVAVPGGQLVDHVDFAFDFRSSPWRNAQLAEDVNNDGITSPIDVLNIINDLNKNGARQLVDEPAPPYLDVNGDGFLSSQDALLVINWLNRFAGAEPESAGLARTVSPGTTNFALASDSAESEAEHPAVVPSTINVTAPSVNHRRPTPPGDKVPVNQALANPTEAYWYGAAEKALIVLPDRPAATESRPEGDVLLDERLLDQLAADVLASI